MAKEKAEKRKAETPQEKSVTTEKAPQENTVLIGVKPVMSYVVACLTSFNSGAKRLVIRARGKAISRAVDTVEVLRRSFAKDVRIEKIEIGTEEMSRPDRPRSNVSTMDIVLVKGQETAASED